MCPLPPPKKVNVILERSLLAKASNLVVKVRDDGGVEEGGDGIEDTNIHTIGEEEEDVARIEAEVLDRGQVRFLSTVLLYILSSAGRGGWLVSETWEIQWLLGYCQTSAC